MIELTTQQAINKLVNEDKMTKYAVAKSLGVSVSSINQWLTRTRMSEKAAKRMAKVYGVKITDVYAPIWKQTNMMGRNNAS